MLNYISRKTIMMNNLFNHTKKSGFTVIELLIVILIIWILASDASSRYPFSNQYKNSQKKCFTNQRYLIGAIEMYNMMSETMLEKAFPGVEFESINKLLIKNNYLSENSLDSKDNICSYGFVDIVGSGGVFCLIHGSKETSTDEDTIYPEVDYSEVKPYYEQYNSLKIKMAKESKKYKNRTKLKTILLNDPGIPSVLLVLILIYALISKVLSLKKHNKNKQ